MTVKDQLILNLLALGVGNRVEAGPALLSQQIDWRALIDQTMRWGLDALAFDGVQALYERWPELTGELDASLGEIKFEWLGLTLQAEQDYEAYRRTLQHLAAFYQEEGIPMLLLKGYGLSLDYPVPQHRPTGDIDIYLYGEWERADRALAEKRGVRIDSSHHHHTVFTFEGRTVENHYDILNIYSRASSRRLEAVLKEKANEGWREISVEGSVLRLPGADFNALFLLRHAASHFASVDINLRQLLDWLLFVQHHGHEVDWPWLYGILRRENMDRFANILHAIGVRYLGFDPSVVPAIETDTALVDRVLAEILHPSYQDQENGTLLHSLWVKPTRWWHNRWKHRLCFSDSLLSTFLHNLHSKFLKPSHFLH